MSLARGNAIVVAALAGRSLDGLQVLEPSNRNEDCVNATKTWMSMLSIQVAEISLHQGRFDRKQRSFSNYFTGQRFGTDRLLKFVGG